MYAFPSRRFATLFSCIMLFALSGCASPSVNTTGIATPAQRITALRAMRNNTDQAAAMKALTREIQQEDDMLIRAEIVRTVGSYSGAASDSLLRSALGDKAPEVRIVACECLGSRKDAESVRMLGAKSRKDDNIDVRLAAVRALGETGSQEALVALQPALENEDPAIQRRAALSMEKLTGKNLDGNVHRWQQYAKGQLPQADQEVSIAQRLRGMF